MTMILKEFNLCSVIIYEHLPSLLYVFPSPSLLDTQETSQVRTEVAAVNLFNVKSVRYSDSFLNEATCERAG
jgi:hypothetical protein